MPKLEVTGELILLTGDNRSLPAQPSPPADGCVRHEARLVEAARRGDGEAFNQLYRLYAPMVHGVLLARVPRKEVDDLVQEVFLTAYTRIGGLREAAAFGGWLAMVARNKAHDYHRRRAQRHEDEAAFDEPHGPFVGAGHTSAEAEAHEILVVIRTLPEAYRETLVMRLVEGLSGPEIAVLCNLTPASVRVNLSRGMKMLREKLRQGETK
ncbi:MAG TPA: sigma-70 family RNA polymerase sigma factor [Pyrinomonadaceae bacterium]|nr:sigma-70 family RNA polymerase sigma factor [Pyrinomonadaceae bacterium]